MPDYTRKRLPRIQPSTNERGQEKELSELQGAAGRTSRGRSTCSGQIVKELLEERRLESGRRATKGSGCGIVGERVRDGACDGPRF
jgi:hypothetical protein